MKPVVLSGIYNIYYYYSHRDYFFLARHAPNYYVYGNVADSEMLIKNGFFNLPLLLEFHYTSMHPIPIV